jgi:3-deoxy-alpha-D-manno-octulosonate 8-oxidase
MVASYLGGVAIAASYVGVVHPLSAGLSVALGTRPCVSNCIVMRAMGKFYPGYYEEFWKMVRKNGINVPKLDLDLNDQALKDNLRIYSLMHEKPLFNALGPDFRDKLNQEVLDIVFGEM